MKEHTRRLWEEQDRHPGDRLRLFSAVGDAFPISRVLYPGSFVDIAASFVFDDVVYVDSDRRAAEFFNDEAGVAEIIGQHRRPDTKAVWRFLHTDYTSDLGVPRASFDLVVSLYAGFVSEHCTIYLRPGGLLLANPSHGDAAMASIDSRYDLAAVVTTRDGRYAIRADDLETYLIPRQPTGVTRERLHERSRGIAYTRSPFAYVFRRTKA